MSCFLLTPGHGYNIYNVDCRFWKVQNQVKTQPPTFVYWLGVMLIEKSKLKLWVRYSPHNYRDGSRGRVQGVRIRRPPLPWDDLQLSNTTGILHQNLFNITSQLCHFLVVHPLLRKVLDLLLKEEDLWWRWKILDPPWTNWACEQALLDGVVSYADVLRGLSCIPPCTTNQKHLQGRLGWRREKLFSR